MLCETVAKGGTVVGLGFAVIGKSPLDEVSVTLRGAQAPVFWTAMRLPMKKLTSVAPNASAFGETTITGGGIGVPVPDSGTVRFCFVGSGSLLTSVSVAFATPVVVGAKLTCTVALAPPATV